jgi:tRNA threonylcarbamoyladenosine biosynthesis protein TsaB
MSAILAIDTSTSRGSVALLADGQLLLDEVFIADRSHSSALFPILERVKAMAPGIGTIAIGLGPGSYAGVRIAIASAIGLGLATNAGLVGIPSVCALETDAARYLGIGDARRETFYFTHVGMAFASRDRCSWRKKSFEHGLQMGRRSSFPRRSQLRHRR